MPAGTTNGQEETPLAGGLVTGVVRVGDTVRRQVGPWSPAVHALLRHLEAAGYPGAPRFLGLDEAGREILTFIEGVVPDAARPGAVTEAVLHDVGALIRGLHRATADFALPPGLAWHFQSLGGPGPSVVCHHDLSPRNTVLRDGRAIAFIDWDLATPEPAIHDLVHAGWQFVPLGTEDDSARQGWSRPPDYGRRLRLLLDAYGLPLAERRGFAARVARRMEATASGIEWLAANGLPAYQRLVDRDVPGDIRRDRAWVEACAADLDTVLQR